MHSILEDHAQRKAYLRVVAEPTRIIPKNSRRKRSDIVRVSLGVHLDGTSLSNCCAVLAVCVCDGAAGYILFCAFLGRRGILFLFHEI